MPPSEASAPGSIGKNTPWSRKCSFSALRVTPGWITQSRSSTWTYNTLFMSRKSTQTPPAGALTWPSSEVPVPNAITGTLCFAQIRTTSWTSAVSCANTTASGGWDSSQVVVWACCSRTACEVTRWLPNRAASASTAAASAFGDGRCKLLVIVVPKAKILPAKVPWQRIYRGSRDDVFRGWNGHHDGTFCRRECAGTGAVPSIGDADRAAMDRLQRPSQHGLLQRDVRSRDRRIVAATGNRPRLHEDASRLDVHRRMPCALPARDSSRRSRAGFDPAFGGG